MSSGPFMAGLFLVLRLLVRFVLWIFYPRVIVIGEERLNFKEAAIVISNHPNTLMDPFQVASRVRKQVFFLANAGLFATPFTNWFFTTFYAIPIKRKEDKGGQGINNADSFAKCDAFLGAGGVLYVAPEGGSNMERRLRPFKTGTARIAFSAIQQYKDLDLSILPIGLNYDRPNRFRSRLLVHVGEPLKVRDWQAAYEENPKETVRTLTNQLETNTRALLIDTGDAEVEEVHRHLESILSNEHPLVAAAEFERSQQLAIRLKEKKTEEEAYYQGLKADVTAYAELLDSDNVDDKTVKQGAKTKLGQGLGLLLGLPIFLYGAINHLFAAGIPAYVARKIDIYIGYQATVKAITGLVTVPLFYYLQYKLVGWYLDSTWAWGYLLTLPLFAWVAWQYWCEWQSFRRRQSFQQLTQTKKEEIIQKRQILLQYLSTSLK